MRVCMFGGVVSMGIVEAGADVDFVAVGDVEPTPPEAADIISRLSRELRRHGLRAHGIPKARVPVVKVDRVSNAVPGSPLHTLSQSCVFQFARPLSSVEQSCVESLLSSAAYCASRFEWNQPLRTSVAAQFRSTNDAVHAMTSLKRVSFGQLDETVEIPLRLPQDPAYGPELYRYPFDLCLQSTGLQHTHLFRLAFNQVPWARHLLIFLKKWSRSCGIVNSFEGLLPSYAMSLMVLHLLISQGLLEPVAWHDIAEPPCLPTHVTYEPLIAEEKVDAALLGFMTWKFFHYFSSEFDYEHQVVAPHAKNLSKRQVGWQTVGPLDVSVACKPPYYHFALKDPLGGPENIGRNLDSAAVSYVKAANQLAATFVIDECDDPAFLAHALTNEAPKPPRHQLNELEGVPAGLSDEETSSIKAHRLLQRAAFHRRKESLATVGEQAARHNERSKTAQDLTKAIVQWIRGSKQISLLPKSRM